MKRQFMDKDFLLMSDTAKKLFPYVENLPIFDWHTHLSPQEIYENKPATDIGELWLSGDHYKWRAMRSCGVSEQYITGNSTSKEKFFAYATCMPKLLGSPLYHWTHLELQRFFDIDTVLCKETADEVWKKAGAVIAKQGLSPRYLIEKSNVQALCTTDDPADDLKYHALLAKENFSCRVLPTFRPDGALNIHAETFPAWLSKLESVSGVNIQTYADFVAVLKERIAFFAKLGCVASDHDFAYIPPSTRASNEEMEGLFQKGAKNEPLTADECDTYRMELMQMFAREYVKHGFAMQLHMGALRNNNTLMYQSIGADTGFDSISDYDMAKNLSNFLDSLHTDDILPKTILFTLNPKDYMVLGTMCGNFQSDEVVGKVQLGTAWWFNDTLEGMHEQMTVFANTGAFGTFNGMLTDSRSFLSFPRHEYFRRILCNFVASYVEKGLYPNDKKALKTMVQDIAFYNAERYFSL